MITHAALQAFPGSGRQQRSTSPDMATRVSSPVDHAQWDDEVVALGGSSLQTWRWGEFKAEHGWTVERIRVAVGDHVGLAQILFRRFGPFSLAYVPRGPVLPDHSATALALFEAIDRVCRQHRAISLVVEPDRPLPFTGDSRPLGFVLGPRHFQPERTVKVPLLAQMRRDTRANVRRAERAGVVIERAEPAPAAVDRFYKLLAETADRNAFGIHEPAYYAGLLCRFGDDALISFARVCDEDAVTLVAIRDAGEGVSLYVGSSTAHRVRGAAALLQVDAMRWAREGGCRRYDLWGIPAADPPAGDLARGRVASSKGERWDGLYQFKTGFGGEIVGYPHLLERRYRPWLGFVARRILPRYSTAPRPGIPT